MQCSKCSKEADPFLNCAQCDQIQKYCNICNINIHLKIFPEHWNSIVIYCQECEDGISEHYCSQCEQSLCVICDQKIHNKGKRAKHQRIDLKINFELQTTDIIIISLRSCEMLIQDQNVFEAFKGNLKVNSNSNFICYITENSITNLNSSFHSERDSCDIKEQNKIMENYNSDIVNLIEKLSVALNFCTFEFIQQELNMEILKGKFYFKQNIQNIYLVNNNQNESLNKIHNTIEKLISKINSFQQCSFIQILLQQSPKKSSKDSELQVNQIMQQEEINQQEEENKLQYQQNNIIATTNKSRSSQSNLKIKVLDENESIDEGFQIINSSLSDESDQQMIHIELLSEKNFSLTNSHSQYENNNRTQPIEEKKQKIVKSSNVQLNTHTCSMPFPVFQNFKRVTLCDSLKQSQILQSELFRLADMGQLMIKQEQFLSILEPAFPKIKDRSELEKVLEEAIEQGLIHKTLRIFDNNNKFEMISLQLEYLSSQCLLWTIKSIKQDLMTPTEKLILSRIKECFALKLTQKSWDMILEHIQVSSYIQQMKDNQMQILSVRKEKDPMIGTMTNVIYIEGEEWIAEDVYIPESGEDQIIEKSIDWKHFVEFLENFFNNQNDQSNGSQILCSQNSIENNDPDFIKKIKNVSTINISNNINMTTSQKKQKKGDKHQNNTNNVTISSTSLEKRAIPGGRYGCAQYIKFCGDNVLKNCSLGKLQLFVQKAINQNIIRHQRTLLIKNDIQSYTQNVITDSSIFTQENSIPLVERSAFLLQKQSKIQQLQNALIDVLKENPQGISLAQIPLHLKKKVFFQINFTELGFPKLKNFLTSMSEVISIELYGTNNSFAKLKSNSNKKQNQKKLNDQAPIYIPQANNHNNINSSNNSNNANNNFNLQNNNNISPFSYIPQVENYKYDSMVPSFLNFNLDSSASKQSHQQQILQQQNPFSLKQKLNQNQQSYNSINNKQQQQQSYQYQPPLQQQYQLIPQQNQTQNTYNFLQSYQFDKQFDKQQESQHTSLQQQNNNNYQQNQNQQSKYQYSSSGNLLNFQQTSSTYNDLQSTNNNNFSHSSNKNQNSNNQNKLLQQQQQIQQNKNIFQQLPNCQENEQEMYKTLGDYIEKIFFYITEILQEQQFGIRIDHLYHQLNKKQGCVFDCKLFQCMNFYSFLTYYCENILEIECKKDTFYIYSKNRKFQTHINQPSLQQSQQQHLQQQQMQQSNQILNNEKTSFQSQQNIQKNFQTPQQFQLQTGKLYSSLSASNLNSNLNQQLLKPFQNQNSQLNNEIFFTSSQNVSYINSETLPNLNGNSAYGVYQQQHESKTHRPEDYNLELKDLKFIEELLDNDTNPNEQYSFKTNFTADNDRSRASATSLNQHADMSSILPNHSKNISLDYYFLQQKKHLDQDTSQQKVLPNHLRTTSQKQFLQQDKE